jgi:hypothetical protein
MAQNPIDPILPYTIWYNQSGEMLGWGHLSKKNLKDLRQFLPKDEMFIICPWVSFAPDRKQGLGTEKLSLSRLAQAASHVIEYRQFWQKGLFDNLTVELAHKMPAKTITTPKLATKLIKTDGVVIL